MTSKLLLNPDSLKTLLTAGSERKKANRTATQEMVNTILLQETGLALRRIRRNDKAKRKRRKKELSNFETISTGTGLSRAQAKLLQHNNIYEYTDQMNLSRNDVEVLERQFAECSRQARFLESQISAVNEQLTGGAAEISVVDLNLILEHTGLGGEDAGRIVSDAISSFEKAAQCDEADAGESTMPRLSLRGVTNLSSNHVIKTGMVHALHSRYNLNDVAHSSRITADSLLFSRDDGMETDLFPSQASTTAPPIFRPSSHPELSQISKTSHTLHSQTDRGLPPLRILKSHSSHPSRPKKRLLEAAGFDEALTRETPRVLHYSSSGEEHNPMAQVEALRRELQVSKAGLSQLNKMVDNNIAWVQQNCDMTQWSSHISARAKRKCRVMAVERIMRVFTAYLHRTFHWTVQQWRRAIQFDRLRGVVSKFCKAKAIVFITKTLVAWRLRLLYRRWTCWVQMVRVQRAVEREAACVEIQRVMRGCLGRRRVHNLRLGKAAASVQSLFRRIHAGHILRRRKEEREVQISNEAALRIQAKLQDLLRIQQAKAELQRRKSQRAAIRIQKVYRGQQGRELFLRKQADERRRSITLATEMVEAVEGETGTSPAAMQGSDLEALASQFRSPPPSQPIDEPAEPSPSEARAAVAVESTAVEAKAAPGTPSGVPVGSASLSVADDVSVDRKSKGKKTKPARQPKRTGGTRAAQAEPLQSAATTIQKVARGKLARSLSLKKTAPPAVSAVDDRTEAVAVEVERASTAEGSAAVLPAAVATEEAAEDGGRTADLQAQPGIETAPLSVETSAAIVASSDAVAAPSVPVSLPLEPPVAAADVMDVDDAGSLTGSVGEDSVTAAVNNVLDALSLPTAHSPTRAADPSTGLASTSRSPSGSREGRGSSQSPPKRGMFNISLPSLPAAISGSFFKNPFGSFSRRSIDPAASHAHASSMAEGHRIEPIPDVDSPHANTDRGAQDDEAVFPVDVDQLDALAQAREGDGTQAAHPSTVSSSPPGEVDCPEAGPRQTDSLSAAISSASVGEAAVDRGGGERAVDGLPEDGAGGERETSPAAPIAEPEAEPEAAKPGITKPVAVVDKRPPKSSETKRGAADRGKATAAAAKEADDKRAKAKPREAREAREAKEGRPKAREAKPAAHGKVSKKSMDGSSSHVAASKTAGKASRASQSVRESVDKAVADDGGEADSDADVDVTAAAEDVARRLDSDSVASPMPAAAPIAGGDGALALEEAQPSASPRLALSTAAAVLRVQQMVRVHLARRRLEAKRREVIQAQKEAAEVLEWATVTIQRGMRGKLGRKRFRVVYERKQVETERRRQVSAAKIQSRMRGMHARKRVARLRSIKEEEDRKVAWLESYQKKKRQQSVAAAKEVKEEEEEREEEAVERPGASSTGLAVVLEEGEGEGEAAGGAAVDLDTLKGTFPTTRDSASRRPASSSSSRKMDRAGRPHTPGTQPAPPSVPRTPKSARGSETATSGSSPDGKPPSSRRPPSGQAPLPPSPSAPSDPRLDGLEERLRQLEAVEKRIKESEMNLVEEAKKAEERIQAQMRLLEEKAKQAEADRLAREELMKLAVGPMSHRSPFVTLGPQSSRMQATGGAMAMMMSTRGSAPPTARSAKAGPLPANAPRLTYDGREWVQLWDDDQQAYYWWCPATQTAQWEQPGMESYYQGYYAVQAVNPAAEATPADDSGYESSGGALTDYSTDHEASYFSESEGGGHDDWQEYWDEQARAKYWYNNATGEASWTKPAHLDSQASSRAMTAASYTAGEPPQSATQGQDAHGWISYIDEETGQLYWHNVTTGEVRWDY